MKCLVCGTSMRPYFTRKFDGAHPFDEIFRHYLDYMEYERCDACSLVSCANVYAMDKAAFYELNTRWHQSMESSENIGARATSHKGSGGNQPPYLQMATLINILQRHEIIGPRMLDFAGGIGSLANLLDVYYQLPLAVYEPYNNAPFNKNIRYLNSREELALDIKKPYDLVINSAMFEHIKDMEVLDEIDACVAKSGALLLHTVVRENTPKDPSYFYIQPCHITFWSNRAMGLFMKRYGYRASIYNLEAKSWLLFKNGANLRGLRDKVCKINKQMQREYLLLSEDGFYEYYLN